MSAWWKVRGEMVGLIGLIGDVMEDWGSALARWSNRHLFTAREMEHLGITTPPAEEAER
jgi:hypothetical protein